MNWGLIVENREIDTIPDSFEVDIAPDVTALAIFKSLSFTPWYALGEFVDNSITSAIKNLPELIEKNGKDYELRIEIDFPPEKSSLIVKDNAAGISFQDMQRALKTGLPASDTSIGLGKHGVGLKAAGLWWGAIIKIDTHPINEAHGWHVEIDISDISKTDKLKNLIKVTSIPHRGYSGTDLTIEGLWQKTPKSKTITSIRSYLPSIYRSFIGFTEDTEELKCSIFYGGKKLVFEYPKLLKAPFWSTKTGPEIGSPDRLWRKDLSINLSSGKKVSGWVGILESLSRDMSGFFLKYRGKGISGVVPIQNLEDDGNDSKDSIAKGAYKPRRIFKQAGGYLDQSFVGELDVSDFGKTITTDSPLWSPEEEDEFISKLLDLLVADDYLKMAANYRRNSSSKHDRQDAKEVDAKEAIEIKDALDGNIDHSEIIEEESLGLQENDVSQFNPETIDDVMTITLHDREGHNHNFRFVFVKDISREFLILTEDPEKRQHEIQLNLFHSSLNGIMIDTSTRKTLIRFGLAIAASEVFNSGYDKSKIRTKMNEILKQLGTKSNDE